jgi:hypothetical protein
MTAGVPPWLAGGCPARLSLGDLALEAHGGYLSVLEHYQTSALIRLARKALAEEGYQGESCSLAISRVPRRKVIRLAFDSPHTYGRRGAHWYEEHHAFARLFSAQFNTKVHAYVLDPEEFEKVVTYASGRSVGGEALRYDDVDPPSDAADENAFEEIKALWPLGYLAQILGVTRTDLVKLPRAPSVLLDLDGEAPEGELSSILPPPAW